MKDQKQVRSHFKEVSIESLKILLPSFLSLVADYRNKPPLKRFTPPPDGERRIAPNDDSGPEYSDSDEDEECEEEEESDGELDPNYVKSSHKNVDEFLKAAQSAERAKQLREKFEKWEKNEIKKEMNSSSVNLYEPTIDDGQMETAKR